MTTCNSAPVTGTFSSTVSLAVQPALTSLAASGGSFSGSLSGSGTDQQACGGEVITITATASGTVAAGGPVSLTLTGMVNNVVTLSGTASGTASSLTGQISLTGSNGEPGSGTLSLTSAGGASSLSGGYSGGGTAYCDSSDTSTGQETFSGSLVANPQPSLSSLAGAGGQFSGSVSGGGTDGSSCYPTGTVMVSGTISGTVSPGGAVSWSFQVSAGTGTFSGSGGTGSTSMLTYNGTIFDSSLEPSPLSISIVLSASSSGSGSGGQPTAPPLQIPGGGSSQVTLPGGTVGASYGQNLLASGGSAPYTWSLTGGSLPPGLTLTSSGLLSGTPTQAGGALFTASATDTTGAFVSSKFALTIAPQSITITTTSLPNGIVGTPYPAQVLNASGGTPPYTFQTVGTLPGGLTFSNGAISGTPTAAGAFTIPVTVTDSGLPALTGSAQLSITINAARTDLVLSQNSVTFTIPNGASVLPAAVRIPIQSNTPSQIINYTFAVTPAVPWLSVQSGGTTPGALKISLTPAALQLTAGAQTTLVVTCASSSPCAGNAQNIAISLKVTAAAPQLVITRLSLAFTASSANPQPVSQSLDLANTGGGSIFINSLTAADSFVTITGNPISLEGGPPSYVTVTVNPSGLAAGFYRSSISVVTSIGSLTVPVTVLVTASASITLNPAGTIFNAQAGSLPGNPNGSFQVSVTLGATVSWNALVLPGAPWLTLNTSSGTSTPENPGTVSFTINSAAAGLAANPYYGAILVSSPNVVDSPRTFIVVLNIVSAATGVTPNPQPAGLLFIASTGAPPAQAVNVFAGTSAAVSYQAASDSSFISVTPATGTTSSGSPAASSISVNLAGLSAGVYTGGVSYAFAGAAVRTVNVTLIVEPGAVTPADRPGAKPLATSSCTPAHLVPTENGLVNSFSQPAAWPTPLSILLVNDCGEPVTNGQVVATFSNGDPPLILPATDTTSGNYSTTWTPRNTAQQVAITVTASAPPLPTATTQIAGQVTPNAAPLLTPNGTLNAFAIAAEPGVPFAPGTIIQIYGSNLASQAASGGVIPLPTSINQTSVIIGGVTAPLYYVSPGQINAQIPFELTAGNPYQLIVNANSALSTPYPIQLVSDAPGIAQFAGGDIIAQHLNGSLVTEAAPAAPGEYLTMYLVGMGLTNQTVPSGTASPEASVLDTATLTLNGGAVTNILYAGLTPTEVGLYQVDFQVPASAPNGDPQLVLTQASGVSNSTVLPVHN